MSRAACETEDTPFIVARTEYCFQNANTGVVEGMCNCSLLMRLRMRQTVELLRRIRVRSLPTALRKNVLRLAANIAAFCVYCGRSRNSFEGWDSRGFWAEIQSVLRKPYSL